MSPGDLYATALLRTAVLWGCKVSVHSRTLGVQVGLRRCSIPSQSSTPSLASNRSPNSATEYY